ncbi:MAG: CBS domain-containing protein [Anaeromyxobacter sp.]
MKRLPVVDAGGALVGMVSRLDLLRTVASADGPRQPAPREIGLTGDQPLSAVMRREVPMVHPDTPAVEVFQAVVATRLNRALVVDDDGRVVGLVTDAELLERVTPALRPGALRALMRRLPFARRPEDAATHAVGKVAADLMTRGVATAREDARVSEAIPLMLAGRQKVLAVTDAEGRLAGIVDRADLLHGLIPEEAPGE